jgi:hypothetical protein
LRSRLSPLEPRFSPPPSPSEWSPL